MSTPLVSIVIPVYNAEKFIRQTVDSVFNQTFSDWEIILVNDGSKDESLDILNKYAEESSGKISVISKRNSGVSDTRNIGIKEARGKYIALLDADDQWLPMNLEMKVKILEENSDISFVFSDMFEVDENLNNPKLAPVGKDENILEDLLLWNGEVIPGPCSNLVIRKSCFDNGIYFKKNLSTIADQNLTVQLAYQFKGKRIPIALWNYRILPGSMSKSIKVMERDCLNTYLDYWKSGYFHSQIFRNKCYSNMYLILAGSFWKDANQKFRALEYLLMSVFINPMILIKLLSKFK